MFITRFASRPTRFVDRSSTVTVTALVLAVAAMCLSACAQARAPSDGETDAAPGIDAMTPQVTDAAAPQVDAPAPQVDAPVGPPPCDELYGTVTDYVLCEELPDRCTFNARTNGGNCNTLCAAFGGACITAFDNDPGAPCVANQEDGCGFNADDEICVCSRE